MDNDPNHTSIKGKAFQQAKSINWWKTPAELPDFNLWYKVKEYFGRYVKPISKDGLIGEIQDFWKAVDVPKCIKYIWHLKAIEVNGEPTEY